MAQGKDSAVVMYTTSWCPYCTRARRLFDDKGVKYTEIDVESVDGAKTMLVGERSPLESSGYLRCTVPVPSMTYSWSPRK